MSRTLTALLAVLLAANMSFAQTAPGVPGDCKSAVEQFRADLVYARDLQAFVTAESRKAKYDDEKAELVKDSELAWLRADKRMHETIWRFCHGDDLDKALNSLAVTRIELERIQRR